MSIVKGNADFRHVSLLKITDTGVTISFFPILNNKTNADEQFIIPPENN
jgi:hypothetical protein